MRVVVLLVLLALVSACGQPEREDRFVRPGAPKTSPSGMYVAHTEGVDENTVVLITDKAGNQLFRDSFGYGTSERNDGAGVLWLSDRDQLWVLLPGQTHQRVDRDEQGVWRRTADEDLPEEIKRLG